MMNIILCSDSDIKYLAVKKWLKKKNLNKLYKIKKVKIKDNLNIMPNQPINLGGITCCYARIDNLIENLKDSVLNYKFIISIENSLKLQDNKLFDVVNIVVKDTEKNQDYLEYGSPIEIDINLLDKYPKFINIINDLVLSYKKTYNNYIFNGCETTLGELINKYYPKIESNNWMKHIKNINRKDQILEVLNKLDEKINFL